MTIEPLAHLDKQEAAMTLRFAVVTAFLLALALGSVIRGSRDRSPNGTAESICSGSGEHAGHDEDAGAIDGRDEGR